MRIHIISNSPINSGFSTVAGNLAMGLQTLGHNIAMTGMQTFYKGEILNGIPIFPIAGDINEVNNATLLAHGLVKNMARHGAEALLCLFQSDAQHIIFTQKHPNTVWYIPLEERIIYKTYPVTEAAKKVKKVIAMTNNAGKQFEKYGVKNTVIYHGYNPDTYHPGFDKNCNEPVMFYAPAKNQQFEVLAGQIPEIWSKLGVEFVVGFVGQNIGVRKRIELLIEAFSIFAKGKGMEVHLHLHTPPTNIPNSVIPYSIQGIDLLELIEYFGIKDRVTFSYGTYRSSGWSPEALNILYNTFDVFATASSGEGFSLCNLESMACGIPQIAPDYMPFNEFLGNSERGLLASGREQFIQTGGYRFLVDPVDLAAKMQTAYENRQLRDKLGRNAAEWAKQHTWDKIVKQFDDVFKELAV